MPATISRDKMLHPLPFLHFCKQLFSFMCRWASLVAQSVKNPPSMQETWVRSLGQEDALEKEMQPTPVFLPGKSHGQRSLVGYSPYGCERVRHDLATKPPPPIKQNLKCYNPNLTNTCAQGEELYNRATG